MVALNGLGLALIYRLDLAAILDAPGTGQTPNGLAAVDQMVWTWLGVGLFVRARRGARTTVAAALHLHGDARWASPSSCSRSSRTWA